ncbi:MAG: prepilin-type N-terminal cleavage/methylation domain-containing protein [Planctomycetota bacterium]
MHRSQGLTLLELLVVLAILSALGTVMIVQTTSLTDESRYQGTIRTLEQVEDAVLGRQPVGIEDPTGITPGFVSDLGRLPQAIVGPGGAAELSELWDVSLFANVDPALDRTFRARTLVGLDDDITMLSGWRGPYVRLPLGTSTLNDGWGRVLGLVDAPGTLTADVGRVTSEGSNLGDAFDPDTFAPAAPLEVVFEGVEGVDRVNGVVPPLTVSYTLPSAASGNEDLIIRLYGIVDGLPAVQFQSEVIEGPEVGETSVVREVKFEIASTIPGEEPTQVEFPKGPKVLVAYQFIGATPPPIIPGGAADLSANEKASLQFILPAGGLTSLPTLALVVE